MRNIVNKHFASGALAASLALVGFAGAALASPSPVRTPSAKRQKTRKFDRLRVLAVSVFGALAIGYAAPASAGLIGDSVHAERLTGSTVVNAKDFTVGAGVEFNDLFFGLDITDNAMTSCFREPISAPSF
jgi:hypothetical protein